jgi:hypothetical protein
LRIFITTQNYWRWWKRYKKNFLLRYWAESINRVSFNSSGDFFLRSQICHVRNINFNFTEGGILEYFTK